MGYVVLAVAAVVLGISKTSIGGAAALSVVAFAIVLPARQSTGTILPLLIVGDVVGVALYRQHADWPMIGRLLPWVLVGLVAGAAFVAVADDTVLRRTIGVLLLVFLLGPVLSRRVGRDLRRPPGLSPPGQVVERAPGGRRPVTSVLAGAATGFCTMTANSAGPVMAMYLLLMRVPKMAFLGSNAWLFLIVNLTKVPFSGALGLVDRGSLMLDATLVPFVLVGCALGRAVIGRLRQRAFEQITVWLATVSAIVLLVT